MNRNLTCPCGETKQTTSSNVGESGTKTGFSPVFCDDGSIMWLCPHCAKKAVPHIEAIRALCGNHKYVNWRSLERLVERRDG